MRPLLSTAARLQTRNGQVDVLLDDQQGGAGPDLDQGVGDGVGHDGRQAKRRLVHEQQPGRPDQGPAEGDHLLLATREHVAEAGPSGGTSIGNRS